VQQFVILDTLAHGFQANRAKRFCHISRFVALAPTGWYMKFVIGTSGRWGR
jgi:hypothetical protein